MLAVVGAVSGIAFLFTPQLLTLPPIYPHVPYNFVYNLRYSFVGLLLGLVLLPTVPFFARRVRRCSALLGALALIVMLTQLDGTLWPNDLLSARFGPAVSAVDSLIGLALGLLVLAVGVLGVVVRRGGITVAGDRRARVLIVAGVVVLVLGSAFGIEQRYVRNRYQTQVLAPLYAWAQNVSNARIALVGSLSNISYPFYGRNDSNYVQTLGVEGADGSLAPVRDCRQFLLAIDRGRYTDVATVVVGNGRDPNSLHATTTAWMAQNHSSRLIFHRSIGLGLVGSVFRVDGPLNPEGCPQA
jgi:hypothetical protein